MSLIDFARDEMRRAGLYDADADYGGMVAGDVEELVRVFSEQGHSGYSAGLVLAVFGKVARFQPLGPLTSEPGEWMEVGEGMWQSRRNPEGFSNDGGATHYLLSDRDTVVVSAAPAPRATEGAQ